EMLQSEKVKANQREVIELYHSCFPPEEKLPFDQLMNLSARGDVEFLAYYDHQMFVGFTFSIIGPQSVFVLYFAVNQKLRNKGYGSEILKLLKERYEKAINLNIEALDPSSSNINERLRRYVFYKKNGFMNTHYKLLLAHGEYAILSTPGFDMESYKKTIQILDKQLPEIK
ncbi:MAG TPA: hypothetical protein DEO81_02460, partial [Erysipelotrichaceae bacterium]|nr:hypothetical protein [Erysipelotrichaceae bacterium]